MNHSQNDLKAHFIGQVSTTMTDLQSMARLNTSADTFFQKKMIKSLQKTLQMVSTCNKKASQQNQQQIENVQHKISQLAKIFDNNSINIDLIQLSSLKKMRNKLKPQVEHIESIYQKHSAHDKTYIILLVLFFITLVAKHDNVPNIDSQAADFFGLLISLSALLILLYMSHKNWNSLVFDTHEGLLEQLLEQLHAKYFNKLDNRINHLLTNSIDQAQTDLTCSLEKVKQNKEQATPKEQVQIIQHLKQRAKHLAKCVYRESDKNKIQQLTEDLQTLELSSRNTWSRHC